MAKKTKRIISGTLVALVVIVAGTLALRAISNFTEGKKLEKYIQTAKARGIPLRRNELVSDCPDEGNGARFWKAAEALLLINKEDGLLLARVTADVTSGRPFDAEFRKKLEALVEKNRKVLDFAAEAASARCFVLEDWAAPSSLPRMGVAMIRVAKLMTADAALQADRGEMREALEECRTGIQLNWKVLDKPVLITGLIAKANVRLLLAAVQWIVRDKEIAPDELSTWIKELDPLMWRSRFARVFPGERILGLEEGLSLIEGKSHGEGYALGLNSSSRFSLWLFRPRLKSELLRLLVYHDDLSEIVLKPFYRQRDFLNGRVKASNPFAVESKRIDFVSPLHEGLSAYFLKEAMLEAMMQAARAGLAAKLYETQNKRIPDSLEALVPGILKEVPLDPFTGKPLVFRIQNGELLIYSLGSNQKDDGGRMTYMITQLVMDKDDDWTWREKLK